jgi:putative hydrolase of the HAD superfamily
MTKPHPSIYRHALDKLDVAPAEAVFVGDKLRVDVAGPQKIGMRAVLVTSSYRVEADPEITPDARIRTIAELPAAIESWDKALENRIQ